MMGILVLAINLGSSINVAPDPATLALGGNG